jgi:hypothetical protein
MYSPPLIKRDPRVYWALADAIGITLELAAGILFITGITLILMQVY